MADTTKQLADRSFFVFVRDSNTDRIRRIAIPSDVQIGLMGNPAELQLLGRLSLASTDYSVTRANKGILHITNNDTIVSVTLIDTPVTGRISLYLPTDPRDGQLHFVKDMSGTADSVPIDVFPAPGGKIDQYDSRTLTDEYGSLALYWFGDRWRILVSGLGLSGIGGAPNNATYLTLSGNPLLTRERRLNVSGSNITLVDNGPNAAATLDLTAVLGGGAGSFTYADVTVDAFGRITAISSNAPASGAPVSASYVTITNEPGLTHERALAVSTGLNSSDGGPNSNVTLSIDDNVVATVTGTYFTGPVVCDGGLSGSLQQLSYGFSYLVAGSNVTIVTQSNGQIVISAVASTGSSGGPDSDWTDGGGTLFTTSSVSIDGLGRYVSVLGSDVYFYVSGTIDVASSSADRSVSVFGGDVVVSGSVSIGSGALRVSSNDVQFGTPAVRIERSGNDMRFFDANNAAGWTLTQLAASGSTSSGSGPTGGIAVPILSLPFLAGTVTSNVATSGSKRSLGALHFNPTLINAFSGTRTYWWRAIVDSSETPVSAAVDLYDVEGIVAFPPGIVADSTLSSSNLTMTQIQIDLTTRLQSVTGSGLIEARLWKTISGSLTSSVTCRGARIDVEYT